MLLRTIISLSIILTSSLLGLINMILQCHKGSSSYYLLFVVHLTYSLPFMQAMDGFLIVLDKDANILYVSETITGYVGLGQVII